MHGLSVVAKDKTVNGLKFFWAPILGGGFLFLMCLAQVMAHSCSCRHWTKRPWDTSKYFLGVAVSVYSILANYLFVIFDVKQVSSFETRFLAKGYDFHVFVDFCIYLLVISSLLFFWTLWWNFSLHVDETSQEEDPESVRKLRRRRLLFVELPCLFLADLPSVSLQVIYAVTLEGYTASALFSFIGSVAATIKSVGSILLLCYEARTTEPLRAPRHLKPALSLAARDLIHPALTAQPTAHASPPEVEMHDSRQQVSPPVDHQPPSWQPQYQPTQSQAQQFQQWQQFQLWQHQQQQQQQQPPPADVS